MQLLTIRHIPISVRNIMFLQNSILFCFCFKMSMVSYQCVFQNGYYEVPFPVATMPIDNIHWYARIGVYYSISRISLCNYTQL